MVETPPSQISEATIETGVGPVSAEPAWIASGWWVPAGVVGAMLAILAAIAIYRWQKADNSSSQIRRDRLEANRQLLAAVQRAESALSQFGYRVLDQDEISELRLGEIAEHLDLTYKDPRLSDADRAQVQTDVFTATLVLRGFDTKVFPTEDSVRYALTSLDEELRARYIRTVIIEAVQAAHYQSKITIDTKASLSRIRAAVEEQIARLNG